MRNDILALIRRMRIIPDKAAEQAELAQLAAHVSAGRPVRVGFINAHALNMCHNNRAFLEDLLECDYLYRDGSGMKILCRMLGMEAGMNMNGTDFIPRMLAACAGSQAALLGTESPYLEKAGEAITRMGITPVCLMDGFRNDAVYVETVAESAPQVIVLAMGMPKQERVARALARHYHYPCLIICGGAILDFLGGKVTRAPLAFRKLGMEWLYRLSCEPRRLFRRYVFGNVLFLLRGARLASFRPA